MSKRAVEFLEEWVSENMVKPVAGAPIVTRPVWTLLFRACQANSALELLSVHCVRPFKAIDARTRPPNKKPRGEVGLRVT